MCVCANLIVDKTLEKLFTWVFILISFSLLSISFCFLVGARFTCSLVGSMQSPIMFFENFLWCSWMPLHLPANLCCSTSDTHDPELLRNELIPGPVVACRTDNYSRSGPKGAPCGGAGCGARILAGCRPRHHCCATWSWQIGRAHV